MVPNERTSSLHPSPHLHGRGHCNPEPPNTEQGGSVCLSHSCHKIAFKGKKKKAEQFLISYTLPLLLYITEYCSTQWISICKHLPAPPAEQIKSFLLQPSACRQKHFLFISDKRLQPFDFKHRHASGLSSRKSVSPRLQIDMFVCRVTLLICNFSF